MAIQTRGLYRIRGIQGAPNEVVIERGQSRLEIIESQYRLNEYWPEFHMLPWEEEYMEPSSAA